MEYVNLLRKIAWSYHDTTGLDWEELFSVASLAYCETLKTWDKKKGSVSTHLWYNVHCRLLDYLKSKRADKNKLLEIEYIDEYDINYVAPSNSFFENLTKEAEEIADLVLKCSGRFVVLTSEEAESRIYNIMSRKGWTDLKIKRALNDLKAACNN
jgi:hypothetical protein